MSNPPPPAKPVPESAASPDAPRVLIKPRRLPGDRGKAPLAALSRVTDAQADLQAQFDRHKCQNEEPDEPSNPTGA